MKILTVIGARPQFIKAAVFRKSCEELGVKEVLLHTGQHYDPDMSTDIFEDLNVAKPDIALSLNKRSHGGMTGQMLCDIEEILINEKPDIVNVFGDTDSTLAGALAASKLNIPVMHIEAGLRSFNKRMPEEINRILTDHVSDYLFCPTNGSVKNLKEEGLTKGVFHVGDVMFDCVKRFENFFKMPTTVTSKGDKKIAVMTIHRAESLHSSSTLQRLVAFCQRFCEQYNVIFPIHPNTANTIRKMGISTAGITLISPLGYLEMQGLLSKAQLVLTDSGGLQKEAYFHRCNCITLRSETEWPETIKSGWNRLWNECETTVFTEKRDIKDFGEGSACKKILNSIL